MNEILYSVFFLKWNDFVELCTTFFLFRISFCWKKNWISTECVTRNRVIMLQKYFDGLVNTSTFQWERESKQDHASPIHIKFAWQRDLNAMECHLSQWISHFYWPAIAVTVTLIRCSIAFLCILNVFLVCSRSNPSSYCFDESNSCATVFSQWNVSGKKNIWFHFLCKTWFLTKNRKSTRKLLVLAQFEWRL